MEGFKEALTLLQAAFEQKMADGDLSIEDLEQFKLELETLIEVIDYKLQGMEEACKEAAEDEEDIKQSANRCREGEW